MELDGLKNMEGADTNVYTNTLLVWIPLGLKMALMLPYCLHIFRRFKKLIYRVSANDAANASRLKPGGASHRHAPRLLNQHKNPAFTS